MVAQSMSELLKGQHRQLEAAMPILTVCIPIGCVLDVV